MHPGRPKGGSQAVPGFLQDAGSRRAPTHARSFGLRRTEGVERGKRGRIPSWLSRSVATEDTQRHICTLRNLPLFSPISLIIMDILYPPGYRIAARARPPSPPRPSQLRCFQLLPSPKSSQLGRGQMCAEESLLSFLVCVYVYAPLRKLPCSP